MPDQSREFNMPACLLAALASGSFARCHCDVFHFCSTRCLPLFFSTSSKTVLLRCSFGFHVDSNRASAHASNERRLSPSCDVRSIRIAIAVPCQEHQQKSLVLGEIRAYLGSLQSQKVTFGNSLMIGASHTDCTTKLKFCRTHDHVDGKNDPPRSAMTR